MHPYYYFPWNLGHVFRPLLGACLYVGTPPFSEFVPRTWFRVKRLCAVSLGPCLPLVGWGAT